jgi:hypothetical protein
VVDSSRTWYMDVCLPLFCVALLLADPPSKGSYQIYVNKIAENVV